MQTRAWILAAVLLPVAALLAAMLDAPQNSLGQQAPAGAPPATSPPATSQPAEQELRLAASRPAFATGFLYRTVDANGQIVPYCLYVPPEYEPENAWPVVLFLSGSGERGNDGFLQTHIGVGQTIRTARHLVPAIVVLPQCPHGEVWWSERMMLISMFCVQAAASEYHLDPKRVYLTGLSLGGAGAWKLGARYPDRFAAIAPVCGFGDIVDAKELAKLPIWCCHGTADDKVPVQRSRDMVQAIRAAGGTVQYKELPGVGHNAWDPTYSDPEFWKWLLAQTK